MVFHSKNGQNNSNYYWTCREKKKKDKSRCIRKIIFCLSKLKSKTKKLADVVHRLLFRMAQKETKMCTGNCFELRISQQISETSMFIIRLHRTTRNVPHCVNALLIRVRIQHQHLLYMHRESERMLFLLLLLLRPLSFV